jgi:hypothetical protein
MKWFNNINTIEDLKKAYRKLAMQHHPDRGGDPQVMAEINNEYEMMFEQIKKQDRNAQKGEHAHDGFRDIIDQIINLHGLDIEICGSWIWIDGKGAYPYRNKLKELGFGWASNKRKWYWHSGEWIKRSRKTLTMEEIRARYGSVKVKTNNNEAPALEECGE